MNSTLTPSLPNDNTTMATEPDSFSLIEELNNLGFRVNIFQDKLFPSWGVSAYHPGRHGSTLGRYFVTAQGITIHDALRLALEEARRPIDERHPLRVHGEIHRRNRFLNQPSISDDLI